MIKRKDYPKTTLEEAIQYFEALAATSDFYRQIAAWLYELKERRDKEKKNEKITQKQLIDYCNNAPYGHCSICPYDSKECKIYCTKYNTTPVGENYNNPERYTDEGILIIENQEEE